MIHYDTKQIFDKYAKKGKRVIELGDQLCDFGHENQFQRTDEYYKPLGIDILSIDLHGKNRALPIDLSKEMIGGMNPDVEDGTELLTDFGTIEHVEDLYMCLVNCHFLTKAEGIRIHVNPGKTYSGHGLRYFTEGFWIDFCKACNYEIVELFSKPPYSKDNPALEVYCVLKQVKGSKMITRAQFNKIAKVGLGEWAKIAEITEK